MASRRRIRRRACEGKIRHLTKENAYAARKHLLCKKTVSGYMNIYNCAFCKQYHIGRVKQSK